jgi:D-alanyl-D-alanine carboxypeptidase
MFELSSTRNQRDPAATNAHGLSRRVFVASATGSVIAPLLASTMAMAQDPSPVSTPSATPSYASLDDLLAAGVANGVPGIALAVDQGGEAIFSGAAGVSSLEEHTPLQPTDRFRIYSITKTFTATVVLQLVDEGSLTFDDTVGQWLDEPAVTAIPNVDTVTVRHLLNHTSGIYDYADDNDSPFWEDAFLGPNADWTKVWTLPELLAYADGANHDPYFAPGTGHHYSNTNYLLLGMIVEQVTGHTYSEELTSRVLTPLDLKDTFLAEGADMPEGVVDGYHMLDGEMVNISASNLSWVWAAGAIVSTTADLQRFAAATFAGELLSPESHKEMFAFIPSDNPATEQGMGLYRTSTPNGTLVGMDGGSAGFTAYMMHSPEEDVTVVVLGNLAPDDGTLYRLYNDALAWTLTHDSGA